MDAFVSVLLPHEPQLWTTWFQPDGAIKRALLEDFHAPLPTYISEEDAAAWKARLVKNGLAAPTCWYKVIVSGLQDEDDKRPYITA